MNNMAGLNFRSVHSFWVLPRFSSGSNDLDRPYLEGKLLLGDASCYIELSRAYRQTSRPRKGLASSIWAGKMFRVSVGSEKAFAASQRGRALRMIEIT